MAKFRLWARTFRAAWLSGYSTKDMADGFDCARGSVYRYANEIGLHPRIPRVPPNERALVKSLRSEGVSFEAIGRVYGCSDKTIRRVVG